MEDIDWNDERELAHELVLGTDFANGSIINVKHPAWPQAEHKAGLNFVTLGRAEYVPEADLESATAQGTSEADLCWEDYEFIVVVKVNEDARAGAPWLLFKLNRQDDIPLIKYPIEEEGI